MKYRFYVLLFLIQITAIAQVVSDRSVICSGGFAEATLGNKWLVSATIGEVSFGQANIGTINTVSGFQQPEKITKIIINPPSGNAFSAKATVVKGVSCLNKKDGKVDLLFSNIISGSNLTVRYKSALSNDTTTLITNNPIFTASYLYSLGNLANTTYRFFVRYKYTENNIAKQLDTILGPVLIGGSNLPCDLVVSTGITADDNGLNDTWIISGIEEYPNNKVEIYNRWGALVWKGAGYNNISVVFKGKNTYDEKLVDGTDPVKGWIELTSR
jgi:hypothetical protein